MDMMSRVNAISVSASFRPCARPSFLPSSKIEALPFSRVLAIVPFTNSYACSWPRAMIASYSSGWCCCMTKTYVVRFSSVCGICRGGNVCACGAIFTADFFFPMITEFLLDRRVITVDRWQ
jgi:hypothetical protein